MYLDGSSAEPLLPEARDAWLAGQQAGWGDPLRLHRPGRLAAQALDRAREVVAAAVGARPDEVVFTGSGVQSSYAAVAGLARGRRRVGTRIVTSAIEHSSVLAAAGGHGRPVSVPVDGQGHLDLDRWRAALAEGEVAAAALQVANHEVGTVQPYPAAAQLCRAADVPLLLDATSALGRLDLTSPEAGWSVLTGAAAAFGGPASVGILVIRRGVRWRAPYPVDDYQNGRWPGAPDVPAIVAAAVALETWLADRARLAAHQHALVGRLRHGIGERVPDVDVVGDPDARVPHLLTCSVLYVDGETLTLELDRAGFAVASGSACSASSETPSHVLAAMGALTHGNIRIGLTRTTTAADVDALLDALPPIVSRIRADLGAP
ncbi:cysteine desulfurase/sulfurtransferase TusA family protein [Microlunatus ginsengisoli]|uniref:Cysteine desulfurase/sulfurtransferase TusA family protein n=1 Tax=Microlunatus ginsengisoli TaxID=363863 RepID=A0ABP6ZUF4_9ACTN